jgi:hypothetical protein
LILRGCHQREGLADRDHEAVAVLRFTERVAKSQTVIRTGNDNGARRRAVEVHFEVSGQPVEAGFAPGDVLARRGIGEIGICADAHARGL